MIDANKWYKVKDLDNQKRFLKQIYEQFNKSILVPANWKKIYRECWLYDKDDEKMHYYNTEKDLEIYQGTFCLEVYE